MEKEEMEELREDVEEEHNFIYRNEESVLWRASANKILLSDSLPDIGTCNEILSDEVESK